MLNDSRSNRQERRTERGFAVIAFSSIYLQKLGFTIAGGSIGLDAFILWGVLLWLVACRQAVIDSVRAVLFVILCATVALGLTIGEVWSDQNSIGVPAVCLFLFAYGTLAIRVDLSRAQVRRCFAAFRTGMTGIAAIVIAQQILQYTVGHAYWPNLDRVVPKALLISGYAYLRPYSWNSPYLTPNGIFFLEPSAASGFLAMAVALEIVVFRSMKRLVLLCLGMLANVAGTGPTIIALFSPLLFVSMDKRLRRGTIFVLLPALIVAGASGALSHFTSRSSEFGSDKSSAYARIVIPFESTITLLGSSDYLLSGNGGGSSPKGDNQVQWPINKLLFEYGLPTVVAFHVYLLVAVLFRSVSVTLTLIVLIPHLFFGGGFTSHTNIMLLVMFGSLLRLKEEAALSTDGAAYDDDRESFRRGNFGSSGRSPPSRDALARQGIGRLPRLPLPADKRPLSG